MNSRNPAILGSLAAVLAFFAFNVQAENEDKDRKGAVVAFEEIDVNADGLITTLEAKEKDSWIADNFSVIDSNRDGYISKSEFKQAVG